MTAPAHPSQSTALGRRRGIWVGRADIEAYLAAGWSLVDAEVEGPSALMSPPNAVPPPRRRPPAPKHWTELPVTGALARDLGELAARHGLDGCVVLCVSRDAVVVHSCAKPGPVGRIMEWLRDELAGAVDAGAFDPPPELVS